MLPVCSDHKPPSSLTTFASCKGNCSFDHCRGLNLAQALPTGAYHIVFSVRTCLAVIIEYLKLQVQIFVVSRKFCFSYEEVIPIRIQRILLGL